MKQPTHKIKIGNSKTARTVKVESINWLTEKVKFEGIEEVFNFSDISEAEEKGTIENPDYEEAYSIMMDYWDYIPESLRPDLDERLKEVGLE